jgi:dihydrodipicolinate synthase/N-acetylneuraminate lyase
VLSRDPQPAAGKALLEHLDICRADLRLPITAPDAAETQAAVVALHALGV